MDAGTNTDRRVCVIGMGCVTAVGASAPAAAAAVRAGIANLVDHPKAMARDGEPCVVAAAPTIDAHCRKIDRFRALMQPAARDALGPLAVVTDRRVELPVFIGLPEARPGLPDALADGLTETAGTFADDRYRLGSIKIGRAGHSAGLLALQAGVRAIRRGSADYCLVGGVDSYLEDDTLDWLDKGEQLHCSSNAWGFVPGEAAGFCLLGSEAAVRELGLPVMATIHAISSATEDNRIKTKTVCIGQGLTQAVSAVTDTLPGDARIDHTICDQNGEAYRADEFGFMLARLSECFRDPAAFSAPASCWGDVGAASGPLFVMLAAMAAQQNNAVARRTLLWTSSEGGQRAAAILNSAPMRGD